MTLDAESNAKPLVCVIVGQTASGKSRLAIELAKRIGGEIVSMDALKVYRGMDIGTAKPSAEQLAEIPHHMLDLVEPQQEFNVGIYLRTVEPVIADLIERGKVPVIDCGTPLYLRAFLSGILEAPDPDPELRAELSGRLSTDLHEELRVRDPVAAERLHVNDRRRLIRALEFSIQTGNRISEAQNHFDRDRDDYRFFMTGPLWPQEVLWERLAARIDQMLAAGWLEEVRQIRDSGGFSLTSEKAIGYMELSDHLDGKLSIEQAVEETNRRTRRLARAQLKWFKRHSSVRWLLAGHESELKAAAIFCAEELEPLLPVRA